MAEYGEPLSEREREVLQLVATGATNREIAYRLGISTNTVKVHLRNIFTKLGAESRTEATMIAVQRGWVDVPSAATPAEAPPSPPPLPWFRRLTLIAALLVALGGTLLSWFSPTVSPEPPTNLLPVQPEEEGQVGVVIGEDSHWSERAQMPTRRAGLALVALKERLYAIGGEGPEGITGAVEVYNPIDDTWSRGPEKPTPVTYVTGGVIDGKAYVPGGCTEGGAATDVLEVFDPAAGQWEQAEPLPAPRCGYALAVYEDRLYLFGGTDGQTVSAGTFVFDPQEGRWETRAPMPAPRTVAAAAPLEDRIYVVGGYFNGRELDTCAVYYPAEDRWEVCASMMVRRGGLGLVALGGRLYAIGGGQLDFNERYDPREDQWTSVETPVVGVWQSPGVTLADMVIYAVGGWSQGFVSLNLAYEPLPFRIFIPTTES
ncbi:MAG TPA: hypothetical protein G4O00_08800 [Thermoflexia bacterium]|nr:hypothetical protein [Thermoflexia bacterium]